MLTHTGITAPTCCLSSPSPASSQGFGTLGYLSRYESSKKVEEEGSAITSVAGAVAGQPPVAGQAAGASTAWCTLAKAPQ